MFKRIFGGRFSEQYLKNLIIILFAVRVVDSLIESDVSDVIGNTKATLRLTRQKVLIQAIEKPKVTGQRRLTRDEQAIDNLDDYVPPDIVVEEFRIRAKINLQTRPRTCNDSLKDLSERNKSRIGLTSSRGDRNIVYSQAESLTQESKKKSFQVENPAQRSIQKSISGNGKIIFNDTEENRGRPVNLDGESKKKFKVSSRTGETKKRTKKWNKWLMNSGGNNSGKKRKEIEPEVNFVRSLKLDEIPGSDDRAEIGDELEKPELIFSTGVEKQLDKRSAGNSQIAQPCHGKSASNVTSYSAASGLKKTGSRLFKYDDFSKTSYDEEKNGSHRRRRRSLKTRSNSTAGVSNEKSPKKASKKSTNANKKKTKFERLSKKSQTETVKSKKKLEKRSNNTTSNFSTTVFRPYLNFFSILLSPLVDAISTSVKNRSTSDNSSSAFRWTLYPSTAKVNFTNLTIVHFSNLSEADIPSPKKIRVPMSTEVRIPSSLEMLKNSTSIRNQKTPEVRFLGTPEIHDKKTPEVRFLGTPEIHYQDLVNRNSSNSSKLSPDPVVVATQESLPTAEGKNGKVINSLAKDLANNSTSDDKSKLPEMTMSAMNKMENPAENLTRISSDVTTDKPEDYREKTTLNFTIIDPNCTESILLNSLRNNSANQTSNIGEAISTYPTLRRYSRNDSVDDISSTKFLDAGGGTKIRRTKNLPNDLSPPSAVRRTHGGNRGRKRSRYKGKMQQPYHKQSWRVQNKMASVASPVSYFPPPTTTAELVSTEISGSLSLAENQTSTLSRVLDDMSPRLSSTTVEPTSLGRREYATQITTNAKPAEDSGSARIFWKEIGRRPIGSDATAGYEFAEKTKQQPDQRSTLATPATTNVAANFSREIQTEMSFHSRASEPRITVDIFNEIPRNEFTRVSTVPYKSTSADSLLIKKILNWPTKDAESKGDRILWESNVYGNKKIEETKASNAITGPVTETVSSIFPALKEFSTSSSRVGSTASVDNNQIVLTRKPVIKESSKKENEIPKETIGQDLELVPDSTKKENLLNSAPKVATTESLVEKRLFASTYPEVTTEFYFTTRRDQDNKMAADLIENPKTWNVLEKYHSLSSTEKPTDIISNVSALIRNNMADVNFSSAITRNPDIQTDSFPTKLETTDSVTIKNQAIAMKLSRPARKARDTRNLAQYEESPEAELDYDVDSFAAEETATKEIQTMREDNNEEGSSGPSTLTNPPLVTVGPPHSEAHRVSFEDNSNNSVINNKHDEETTVIPTTRRLDDYQSPSATSTAGSTNSLDFFNAIPENLTNLFEEPELLEFVKSLEEFLFDDSATGTTDRKKMRPKNDDLDTASSSRNIETRSAIFKTKRWSLDKRSEKKSESRNSGKRKSTKSTMKSKSDISFYGKRISSKVDKKTMKARQIKAAKKSSVKTGGKAKVLKTQSRHRKVVEIRSKNCPRTNGRATLLENKC